MVAAKFKYRLKSTFIDVFGARATAAKYMLIERADITFGTLSNDLNLLMTEEREIPESRLMIYADYLGVTTDYLKADYIAYLKSKIQCGKK